MKYIALLGLGVVGKGTADLIENNRRLIAERLGDEIEIKYILDLRNFYGTPYESKIVHDINVIVNDSDVEIVAEMMGGSHPAYDYTKACLEAGKSVVTSNKEVVANFGCELLSLARKNEVAYAFEASVGGGIPIVRPLFCDFLSGEVTKICGILNGTTNYILTEMESYGKNFATALSEAQEKGYAERDPSADVDGIDTCRKICILTALASGIMPDASKVTAVGIRDIKNEDVSILAKLGKKIKLLGVMNCEHGRPCCIVAPFVCGDDNPLSHVNDVFNGIMVHGNMLGDTMFYGRGAGAEPTASAVATDIIATLRDGVSSFAPTFTPANDSTVESSENFACRRYIRSALSESELSGALGILRDIGGAYITENSFTEREFDIISGKLGLISSLRIL